MVVDPTPIMALRTLQVDPAPPPQMPRICMTPTTIEINTHRRAPLVEVHQARLSPLDFVTINTSVVVGRLHPRWRTPCLTTHPSHLYVSSSTSRTSPPWMEDEVVPDPIHPLLFVSNVVPERQVHEVELVHMEAVLAVDPQITLPAPHQHLLTHSPPVTTREARTPSTPPHPNEVVMWGV